MSVINIFKQLKSAQKKGVAVEIDCDVLARDKQQRYCESIKSMKGWVLSLNKEEVKLKSFLPTSVKMINIDKIISIKTSYY
ncbi:hypothetical protein ACGP04_06035 [Piscirickettsia salmonis]|uniref:hypothetical protein n=1 Tax=Piscirickettsia salmonis TaxID=1238 RepID=UPI000F076C2F|nr:hypothetical protein DA717_08925 [Piscirickettsiaceae bacterium NZ-RLO2]